VILARGEEPKAETVGAEQENWSDARLTSRKLGRLRSGDGERFSFMHDMRQNEKTKS
jgi:hypothetical protein